MRRNWCWILLVVPVAVMAACAPPTGGSGPLTRRISVASNGAQATNVSYEPSISSDGRYIAYYSDASNLAPGDTNHDFDVFVRDRNTAETTRVSVTADGTQGNGGSFQPTISSDGRFVTYHSEASNLVAGDTNNVQDVFVYDRATASTTRVSVASDGSEGNGYSFEPSVSSDGRYITYYSAASNLVPGDTNNAEDVFVFDRTTGGTARVSVASDGSEGNGYSSEPAISSDGRYVSYHSDASNLVAGDTNNAEDVFVFDRTTGGTAQISAASDGSEGNQGSYEPELSSDGRYLTYHSAASNLVPDDTNELEDVFLWDRVTGETVRVSTASDGAQANSSSFAPAINGNGRYITYESLASNLVSGDANGMMDVFVWDRTTTETVRASVATDGSEGNGYSFDPVLSSDGRYVAYYSWSTNLVPGDTNFAADVFVWSRSGQ